MKGCAHAAILPGMLVSTPWRYVGTRRPGHRYTCLHPQAVQAIGRKWAGLTELPRRYTGTLSLTLHRQETVHAREPQVSVTGGWPFCRSSSCCRGRINRRRQRSTAPGCQAWVSGLQKYYYTHSAYTSYGKFSCIYASFVSILQQRAGLPGVEVGEKMNPNYPPGLAFRQAEPTWRPRGKFNTRIPGGGGICLNRDF